MKETLRHALFTFRFGDSYPMVGQPRPCFVGVLDKALVFVILSENLHRPRQLLSIQGLLLRYLTCS